MFCAKKCYTAAQCEFSKIPGSPVAYWVSEAVMRCYDNLKIGEVSKPCKGIDTGDNLRFLRFWYEVKKDSRFVPNGNRVCASDIESFRWFPYNKGGEYRKWYGNNEYVLDWSENGEVLRKFPGSNLRNKDKYFLRGITWSTVTSGMSSFRFFDYGYLFDNGGSCLFAEKNLFLIQGLLNSCVSRELLALQPTINNQPGTIASIPIILGNNENEIESMVKENIVLSCTDWDSFETSWDFARHPLVRPVPTITDAYTAWQGECKSIIITNRF